MSDLVDINSYIQEVTRIEDDIAEAFDRLPGTEGPQRQEILKKISQNIKRARDYVSSIQMELFDLDPKYEAEYQSKYDSHNKKVTEYEEQLKNEETTARNQEKAKVQGLTNKDLMDKSLKLQETQMNSLTNSINTINQAKETGSETLVEIARQKEVLEKVSNDLNEMDSELFRAKKIIKVMFTRAARDKCLRILALLVLLAVIAVIVVECVKPGSVKKSTEGWFNVENGNITTSKLF